MTSASPWESARQALAAAEVLHPRLHPAGPSAAAVRGRSGGIGRGSSSYAEAVSDGLRRIDSELLSRRRRVGGYALGAVAALVPVALYQVGLLRSVPEPPLPFLDADAVDATGAAYALFGTPDSALGIASYAVTFALAGMGRPDRAQTQPLLPLLMSAKVALDAVSGAYLLAEQLTKHRKICSWCTAASLLSFAMVPQVVPETRSALRSLLRTRD